MSELSVVNFQLLIYDSRVTKVSFTAFSHVIPYTSRQICYKTERLGLIFGEIIVTWICLIPYITWFLSGIILEFQPISSGRAISSTGCRI